MAALLAAFVACLLAGIGGRGQMLAITLTERFGRRRTIGGLAASSALNAAISAAIGYGLATIMPVPARMLLLGLALISCGASMLLRSRPPADPGSRGGMFTIIVTSLALNIGDRGQFLVTGIACAFPYPALAALGGGLGGFGALLLPLIVGKEFGALPMSVIRRIIAALFLTIGFALAINMLGLS